VTGSPILLLSLMTPRVAFGLGLLIGPFVLVFLGQWAAHSWLLPFDARWWLSSLGAAVVYAILAIAFFLRASTGSPTHWVGLVLAVAFLSWVAGCGAGPLVLRLANCAWDPSPAEEATVDTVTRSMRYVRVRISAPYPGAEFVCPDAAWTLSDLKSRFFVHRGRLGVLWGEVK
jgi:hypothetical protein